MNRRNIVGKSIRKFRIERKLTQEQLTAKIQLKGLELDRPMLSKIENNKREVLDFEVKAFSEALEIPIEQLFKE